MENRTSHRYVVATDIWRSLRTRYCFSDQLTRTRGNFKSSGVAVSDAVFGQVYLMLRYALADEKLGRTTVAKSLAGFATFAYARRAKPHPWR